MNVTFFLSTQVWSRTDYGHKPPAGLPLRSVQLSLVSISLKQASGGPGSEYKCEYIHPHAALLNLWA